MVRVNGHHEAGGMLRLLIAALFLLCQGLAQAAMPADHGAVDAIEQLAMQTLCHGAPADDRAPAPVPDHHDCLLCPVCHLAGHAVVLDSDRPAVFPPVLAFIGLASPLPAATGPPLRSRVSAQPTGPPAVSA